VHIGFGSLDTGSVELSAPSVYSGNTVVDTGTLVFGASSNGSVGAITSGPIGLGNLVFGGGTIAASSEVTIKNPIYFSYSSSNLTFNGSSNLSLAASFSLGTTRNVHCSGDRILTLDGVLSGGSLVKQGSGTLKLTKTNTYTGTTQIQAGTIQICDSTNLGTNTIVLSGGCLSSNSTNGIILSNNLTVSSLSTLGDVTNKGPLIFTSNISITSGGGITTPSGVENNLPNLILSEQTKFLFTDTNNLSTGNLTIGNLTSTSNLIGSGSHWINLYYSNNSTPTSEYKSLIKHSNPSLVPNDFALSGDYLAANQIAILASDSSSVGVILKNI
jgi:autotransporter-associated beta strand protein/predicted outer membrane repeat protein